MQLVARIDGLDEAKPLQAVVGEDGAGVGATNRPAAAETTK